MSAGKLSIPSYDVISFVIKNRCHHVKVIKLKVIKLIVVKLRKK